MGGLGESGTRITDNKRCNGNAVTSLTMDGNTYCKLKATLIKMFRYCLFFM